VTYQKHLKGPDGNVSEVQVTYDPEVKGKPPKGVLSWVSCPAPGKDPSKAEVRLYAEAVCHTGCSACIIFQTGLVLDQLLACIYTLKVVFHAELSIQTNHACSAKFDDRSTPIYKCALSNGLAIVAPLSSSIPVVCHSLDAQMRKLV
jgi:hypothetical protein